MKIYDVVLFGEDEYRMIQRAWRWTSVTSELGLSEEENKTLNRFKYPQPLTRPQVKEVSDLWKRIKGVIERKIAMFTQIANGEVQLAHNIEGVFHRPKEVARDTVANLKDGIGDIDWILELLAGATNNMTDPPKDPDEDSEEYLNLEADQIVVQKHGTLLLVPRKT